MSEFKFKAKKSAGSITLEPSDGQTYVLPVSVLDMPLWRKYQELERKIKGQKDKPKSEQNGAESIDGLFDQLKLLCPSLESKHLKGFDFNQCLEILNAMVSIATGTQAKRSEAEKKTTSAAGTTSSRSRKKASLSASSMMSA